MKIDRIILDKINNNKKSEVVNKKNENRKENKNIKKDEIIIEIKKYNIKASETDLEDIEKAKRLAINLNNKIKELNDESINIQGKNLDWNRVINLIRD